MINEHANQNIWQAGVKQFVNGMPKPFRDKHRIAVVHQRLGKLSTIHFQLGLRKQSQARFFHLFVQPCACMDRGGKASTMCPGQSFLQKIQSSCPKKLHADGNCSVLLSYYLYWLININYQLSICFHVRGDPLWHHPRNEVVLLPLVTTLYIPCCLEKPCQSRIMWHPTVSERSCWCL